MKRRYWWLEGLLILAFGLLLFGNESQWKVTKSEFDKSAQSLNVRDRVAIANKIAQTMYPEVEKEAVSLLVRLLTLEIERGKEGKKEEDVKYEVLEAAVNALKKITDEKAIESLIKTVKTPGTHWRVRVYLIKALGGIKHSKVTETLVQLIKDKDALICVAALDALAALGAPEGANIACELLKANTLWEIKVAAANYLAQLKDESFIEPLIEALGDKNNEGRVQVEIANALKKITGQDFGLSTSSWRAWWEAKKQGKTPPAGNSGTPGEEGTTKAVYYGVKVTSTRIIFIMDISGSMAYPAKWTENPEEEKMQPIPKFTGPDGKTPAPKGLVEELKKKKEEVDKREVTQRIHAVKRELINTIYHLDPSVHFTIIFFSTGVFIWKDTLIPATAQNKKEAIDFIEKQQPTALTAIYDALEMAFNLADKLGMSGKRSGKEVIELDRTGYAKIRKLGGADTIFLVTDGRPTTGKIQDPQAILQEIKKLNETRKIIIHTVAVGVPTPEDSGPDVPFLRELAAMNGGQFIDRTK